MRKSICFSLIVLCCQFSFAQNIGIGTTLPATSAQLDVSSTSKGFLPPRLSIIQRIAIQKPIAGLTIYCTDCNELQVFNGNSWINMNGAAACITAVPASIKICDQVWMTGNLSVNKYQNGDPIPEIQDSSAWANATTGAWCWYKNDSASYHSFGKLYNWFAVNDPRGIAPQGWHLPSDAEWNTLFTCVGGISIAAGALKEAGLNHWGAPNEGATNSSGFSAIGSGVRAFDASAFYDENYYCFYWRKTAFNTTYAYVYFLDWAEASVQDDLRNKKYGYSVRCLKD